MSGREDGGRVERDSRSARSRGLRRALSPLLVLLGLTGPAALAQPSPCQGLREELARLGRSAPETSADPAMLYRLSERYRALGCERPRFPFFDAPQPAECAALAERMRRIRSGGNSEAALEWRRRQLLAALDRFCHPDEPSWPPPEDDIERGPRLSDVPEPEDGDGWSAAGGRLICVRACDGYFFPLAGVPDRIDADDMCQALCPAADTAAYRMPENDDLGRAVSRRGEAYASAANAFRYQKRFDPQCSCRKPGESWAEALRTAEQMMERHRGDILVTPALAEAMSRPKPATREPPRKDKARPERGNAGRR